MRFMISASTDIGLSKETNQDSLTVKRLNTDRGEMVFALLCDGMGGLAKGEVASASVIRAFDRWVRNDFPRLAGAPLEDGALGNVWNAVLQEQNTLIQSYGARFGIKLGTTAVVMLLTQERYYIMNVGDSRAYELSDNLYLLTKDQTFVEREIDLGHMTPEQAERDPRRSVLMQCIGASDIVSPDYYVGTVKPNATYLLCSDGFRHEISPQEIYAGLRAEVLPNSSAMQLQAKRLIETNKQRMERDNISIILIRTWEQEAGNA